MPVRYTCSGTHGEVDCWAKDEGPAVKPETQAWQSQSDGAQAVVLLSLLPSHFEVLTMLHHESIGKPLFSTNDEQSKPESLDEKEHIVGEATENKSR